MPAEPLWRGPVEKLDDAREVDRLVPEHTEVVVFRADSLPACPRVETGDEGTSFCRLAEAGDRPVPPTRQQIVDAIDSALNDPRLFPGAWSRTPAHYVDAAADALLELLSGGVPTEPEETTDWEPDEVNRRSAP